MSDIQQATPLRLRDVREAEEARVGYASAKAHEAALVAHAVSAVESPQLQGLRAEVGELRRQVRAAGLAAKCAVKARTRRKAGGRRPSGPEKPAAEEAAAGKAARRPAVSVMTTVYNNGAVLQRAIESVRRQTLPDWELIIVDDGSTDPETLAIVEATLGPQVVKHRQANGGVIAARSAAAELATGDIMVFLDPDDWLEPTYLEKALLTLARYPGVDIVCPGVRVHSGGGAAPFWFPAHFEEKRLAYENTVPISSAFRRRVWDAVGSMPEEFAEGFEDWGFWRLAAAAGFRGWSLDDALMHYWYSESTGRDAAAREMRDELERRIKQLNPLVSHPAVPIDSDSAALREAISRRVFHLPSTGKPPLVVFVPWLLAGGGAETFLHTALPSLRDEFEIVIIATHRIPENHDSALNEFLEITPYVYDLAALVGPEAMFEMVQSLLFRLAEPNILVVGSPWAYAHLPAVKRMGRGWGRVVDVQFNHVGHLAELLGVLPEVDEVLVAHRHLKVLLTEYFGVEKPVEVLYIAPPEHEALDTVSGRVGGDRLRIGWLGRNSAEKRPDLVGTIGAALPEVSFVMAGSALNTLPVQPPNVEVIGWVEDKLAFLGDLDFVLNTSDVEGVSVTAMEALQLGVPVITRDVGGMSELVRDGDNGLIYDIDGIERLADRLRQPDLVRRVAQTAQKQRLPSEFHANSMVNTLRVALLGRTALGGDRTSGTAAR